MDLNDLTLEESVVNEDCRSNNHGLTELLVCASHASVVTLDLRIDGDGKLLAFLESDIFVFLEAASPNLRAFGVKHDRALLVLPLLEGFLQVFKGFQVRLHFKVRVTFHDQAS